FIQPGTGVTTTRADVHWVVTEYGAVNLHGRSVPERVKDLVSIADPKFRDELLAFAKEKKYL
ncbi:MAG TPA: 4-hydroxybutyrate CoA-transferase, partial [candidate division Zixibacteria bacterium]|nr:4-hydroxybutyrate CoA-transferase [candidate division Zixibacteria bacterium]